MNEGLFSGVTFRIFISLLRFVYNSFFICTLIYLYAISPLSMLFRYQLRFQSSHQLLSPKIQVWLTRHAPHRGFMASI